MPHHPRTVSLDITQLHPREHKSRTISLDVTRLRLRPQPTPLRTHIHREGDAEKCKVCCPTATTNFINRPLFKRPRTASELSVPGGEPVKAPASSGPEDDTEPETEVEQEETNETEPLVGMMQSPIDIHPSGCEEISEEEGHIDVRLQLTEAELAHHGTNFQIRLENPETSVLTLGTTEYRALQFHFHTPSEHTFDGEHEELEFHLVHKNEAGEMAVIAVFFHEGEENPFLAEFWDKLAELPPDEHNKLPLGVLDMEELVTLHSERFFRYRGSLTTPPYTEGVEWIILQDVAEASREQLDLFRNLLPGPNAREVQPINKRCVCHVG